MVERALSMREVAGSMPASSKLLFFPFFLFQFFFLFYVVGKFINDGIKKKLKSFDCKKSCFTCKNQHESTSCSGYLNRIG